MLTIQCTKKLGEELKIDLPKEKPADLDELFAWHSHLFLFNRRKCVLVINNMTRYNFVLVGLKKDQFKQFGDLVLEAITENLLADGMKKGWVKKYVETSQSISYAATSNRSIISQMNEMISVSKMYMEMDRNEGVETDLYKLNRKLNKFVMLKLPLTYSGETMRQALENRCGEGSGDWTGV